MPGTSGPVVNTPAVQFVEGVQKAVTSAQGERLLLQVRLVAVLPCPSVICLPLPMMQLAWCRKRWAPLLLATSSRRCRTAADIVQVQHCMCSAHLPHMFNSQALVVGGDGSRGHSLDVWHALLGIAEQMVQVLHLITLSLCVGLPLQQ